MKKVYLFALAASLVGLALLVALLRHDDNHRPLHEDSPRVVQQDDAAAWMQQLQSPSTVEFREEFSEHRPANEGTSKTVYTFGRLSEFGESIIKSDLRMELANLDDRIEAAGVSGGNSDLKAALAVADLLLHKAKISGARDMLARHDYSTIKSGSPAPPEIEGYDRVVHGPIRDDNKEPLDVEVVSQPVTTMVLVLFPELWLRLRDGETRSSNPDRRAVGIAAATVS